MKRTLSFVLLSMLVALLIAAPLAAQTLKPGSAIFVAPGEFSPEISAAIMKKKVPVILTTIEDKADYVLTAETDAQKEGAAERVTKVLVLGAWAGSGRSRETAVTLTDKAGTVIWAYQTNKAKAQSAAEGVAKHLKDTVK
jgi:hypothetical protein